MRAFFSFLLSSSPAFSITFADLILAIGIGILMLRILKGKEFYYPKFFLPLVGYSFVSLLSAVFSANPTVSLIDTKELFIFFIPPIAILGERKWLKNGLILGVSLAAFLGVIREVVIRQERLTGFVGHYMTEGGIMMISFLFVLALFLFEKASALNTIALVLIFVALVLTLTRSSWVGTFFGVVLLLYWKRKWLPLLLIPLVAVFLYVSPDRVRERAFSIFSLTNVTNVERLHMWRIGAKMFKDYPILGCGQNMVSVLYPSYNKEHLSPAEVPHLHNNFFQIGVERGILGLIFFLGFLTMAFIGLFGIKEGGILSPEAMGAVAVLLGFIIAGFFEYNFGDSEVKLLLLTVLTIPFVKDYKEVINDKNP